VQKHDEKKNHGAQECCGEPGVFLEDNTYGGGGEGDADEIDPEEMRGNPGGDAGGHKAGDREVFSGEDGQGNGVKEAAKGKSLSRPRACGTSFLRMKGRPMASRARPSK